MATPALARPLESTGAELGVQPQATPKVIPYLSHGLLGESVKSRPAAAQQPRVINYLSHGMTADDAIDPRTGIPLSAGIPAAGDAFVATDPKTAYQIEPGRSWYLVPGPAETRPDVQTAALPDAFERAVQTSLQSQPVRPDDRGDRFVVGDGTPPVPVAGDDGFSLDWGEGLAVGAGGLAIVLALGLAVAYVRRPRVAL